MKTLRVIIASVVLAFSIGTLAVTHTGCKSPNRATYTTLAALAKAVDIAEREYMDGVVDGTIKTNDFPRLQSSYAAFQGAYGVALAISMNDSNRLAPESLSRQAAQLILDLQSATKAAKKGK